MRASSIAGATAPGVSYVQTDKQRPEVVPAATAATSWVTCSHHIIPLVPYITLTISALPLAKTHTPPPPSAMPSASSDPDAPSTSPSPIPNASSRWNQVVSAASRSRTLQPHPGSPGIGCAAEAEDADEGKAEGEVPALSSPSTHVGQVDTVLEGEGSAAPTSDVGSSERDSSHRSERLT